MRCLATQQFRSSSRGFYPVEPPLIRFSIHKGADMRVLPPHASQDTKLSPGA